MSRKIYATYEMIKGYKYYPSNIGLALSEFIDNSISSYIGDSKKSYVDDNNNHDNDDESINGLEITLIFENLDENNSKIIISDNANGMSSEEIEKAMQPSDRINKSNTKYNQYGVGMKLGIFWFGSDCKIWSKQNNKEYKLEFLTSDKDITNQNEDIYVESKESFDNKIKYSSGTTIEISHVYEDKNPFLKNKIDGFLTNFLGWRYNKLIQKGLKIKLEIQSNEKKKNQVIIINEFINKPFNVKQLFDENLFKKNIIEQRKSEWKKSLENINKNFNENTPLELIQVYEKIINEEDVELTKEITINGKQVNLNFAIMSANQRNKSKKSGVTIYHRDRAIYHGPNDEIKSNFQFTNSIGSQNPTHRWLYGSLNLTGIENPDQNKNDFQWSIDGESDLKKELKNIYDNLEDILSAIASVDKITTNKNPTKEELLKTTEIITTKFSKTNIHDIEIVQSPINDKEFCSKSIWDIFGDQYEVIIGESNEINSFLKLDVADEHNKIFKILIQADNKFWKPLIKNNEFKQKMLFPFCIILAFTEWIYNNPDILEKYDKYHSKSFVEIIDALIEGLI